MNGFDARVTASGAGPLTARGIEVLQVNLGLRCNQACRHCHLEASPRRTERMAAGTMRQVAAAADAVRPRVVDVTGGAPELHPGLRGFVDRLRAGGHAVQVRTNLTALREPGCEGLAAFFAARGVRLVASLPCYLEENVDRQRGAGAWRRSLEALRELNAAGYGGEGGPELDLVHNPVGPSLPPDQQALERDYRRELGARHGISFTRLLTITNVPLGRFGSGLRGKRDEEYGALLHAAFNPRTLPGLMCLRQLEIGWDGAIYDCDFNLALGLRVDHGAPDHLSRFDAGALARRRIVTGEHCFGCTAGAGSSCGGAIACGA